METATLASILLSIIAFVFSVYTLWAVRVSPYRLLVYPPALSVLNPKEAFLVLDLTFFNPGRARVAVLDMEVTLWSKNGVEVVRRLKPQACHQTLFPRGDFSAQSSMISRFSPFMINQQETLSRTIYFAAADRKWFLQSAYDDLDRICIAFKVNDRWNRKAFNLNYAEFQAFQREAQHSALPKMPFASNFFPDVKPLDLRGSIFDPAF
jgi:hypothetical protein